MRACVRASRMLCIPTDRPFRVRSLSSPPSYMASASTRISFISRMLPPSSSIHFSLHPFPILLHPFLLSRRKAVPVYGVFARLRGPKQLARSSADAFRRQEVLLQDVRQDLQQNVAAHQARGRRLRHPQERRNGAATAAAARVGVTKAACGFVKERSSMERILLWWFWEVCFFKYHIKQGGNSKK